MASSPRAPSHARHSVFPQQVIYLGAHPAQGARFAPVPEAAAVERWRERAASQREECLARFDLALVSGKDPNVAAREILAGFLTWTRWSEQGPSMNTRRRVIDKLRLNEFAHDTR